MQAYIFPYRDMERIVVHKLVVLTRLKYPTIAPVVYHCFVNRSHNLLCNISKIVL